ncbi:Arm DNA-binding domain-containing protein [Planktotalea sp.]|uniref:Arm DNA-binding domain-containing protein n=1 Tax=Planktotalea sp. TaxID=2029877 RepID=UPI003D6B85A4
MKANGSKLWQFKYRFYGKERRLSIGVYPEVILAHPSDLSNPCARVVLACAVRAGPSMPLRTTSKFENGVLLQTVCWKGGGGYSATLMISVLQKQCSIYSTQLNEYCFRAICLEQCPTVGDGVKGGLIRSFDPPNCWLEFVRPYLGADGIKCKRFL